MGVVMEITIIKVTNYDNVSLYIYTYVFKYIYIPSIVVDIFRI